jgi:DNA modification methylase
VKGFRDRIKELRRVKAKELIPHAHNWRRHPPAQKRALEAVLREVGWADAVLAYETKKGLRLIDGHLRADVAPDAEIPVLILDVDDEEAAKILATHDPLAAMAEADGEALRRVLEAAQLEDEALKRMVDGLLPKIDPAEGLTDPDAVPEPPEKPVSKRGDLWILGEHRLLCGDSSKAEDVDRLLDGARVHLVCADPPYNVRVEPRSNNAIAAAKRAGKAMGKSARTSVATSRLKNSNLDLARHPSKARATGPMRPKDRPLENDWLSDAEFDALIKNWFGQMQRVLIPGGSYYVWGGFSNVFNYPAAITAADLYFSQVLIWVKGHPVLTRKDFMGNHEWCFHGWKKGAAHRWFGPNNVTDVWSVKKVAPQNMVHLCDKPVELSARAMEYSSRRGENVLDLFAGGGSACIAAEQLGRRSFNMEIDCAYADVVVARWEAFTGKKAKRAKVC